MRALQKAVWHITRKTARYPLDVIAYALTNLKDMCVQLRHFEIKKAGKHFLKAIFAVFLRLAEMINETIAKLKKNDNKEEDGEDQKIKLLGLGIENSGISQTVLFSGVNVLAWTALAAIIAFPLLGPVPLVAAAIVPTFAVAFSLWSAAARLSEGNVAGLSLTPLLGGEISYGSDLESSDSEDNDSVVVRFVFAVARFFLGFVAMPFVSCMAVALLLEDILSAFKHTANIRDKKSGLTSAESWKSVFTDFVNRLLQVVTLPILFAITAFNVSGEDWLVDTDNVFALEHRGLKREEEEGEEEEKAQPSNLIFSFNTQEHPVRSAVSYALLTGGVLGALVGTGVLDLASLLPQLAMLGKEAKIIASVGLPLALLTLLMVAFWIGRQGFQYLADKRHSQVGTATGVVEKNGSQVVVKAVSSPKPANTKNSPDKGFLENPASRGLEDREDDQSDDSDYKISEI